VEQSGRYKHDLFDRSFTESVHALIAGLIGHVNMYVGQLVAFCHATGIDIPEDAIESLGLDG